VATKAEDLLIRIKGDVSQLEKELNRGEKSVRGFGDKIRKGFGAIRPALLGAVAAVTAAAGTLTLMGKNALQMADDLGKAADRIGITTEGLQRLRYAADLAGVGNAQFDKALSQLIKRMGEAARGSGSLITGLQGVDDQLLANLQNATSTEEAFLLIADAIAATEDPAKRAAIANATMGRQGILLINTLAQGSEAIKRQGDELQRFGGLLTREAAAAAESFNDSLTELATFVSTKFAQSFLGAEGGVRTLADLLRDEKLRTAVSGLAGDVGSLAKAIVEVGANAVTWYGEISRFFDKLIEYRDNLGESLVERTRNFFGLRPGERWGSFGFGEPRSSKLVDTQGGLPEGFTEQALLALGFGHERRSAPVPVPSPRIGGFTPKGVGKSDKDRQGEEELRKVLALLREEEKAREDAQNEFTRITQAGVEERLRLAGDEIGLIQLRRDAELKQLDELAPMLIGQEKEIQAARLTIIANANEEIRQANEQTAEKIKDLFITAGEFAADVVGGLLLQQEQDWNALLRSMLASLVKSGLTNAVNNLATSASKALAGGGAAAGGALGFVGTALKLFGFDEGGIALRPTAGIFAERRPEAVMPLTDLNKCIKDREPGVQVNITEMPGARATVQSRRDSSGRQVLDMTVEATMGRLARQGSGRGRHTPGTAG